MKKVRYPLIICLAGFLLILPLHIWAVKYLPEPIAGVLDEIVDPFMIIPYLVGVPLCMALYWLTAIWRIKGLIHKKWLIVTGATIMGYLIS